MNSHQDEPLDDETNSSKYSDPRNIDMGDRPSFHSAFSGEDNSDNDKQFDNLPETLYQPSSKEVPQKFLSSNTYEVNLLGSDKSQGKATLSPNNTNKNTFLLKKTSSDEMPAKTENIEPYSSKNGIPPENKTVSYSGFSQFRDNEKFAGISMGTSEIVPQKKEFGEKLNKEKEEVGISKPNSGYENKFFKKGMDQYSDNRNEEESKKDEYKPSFENRDDKPEPIRKEDKQISPPKEVKKVEEEIKPKISSFSKTSLKEEAVKIKSREFLEEPFDDDMLFPVSKEPAKISMKEEKEMQKIKEPKGFVEEIKSFSTQTSKISIKEEPNRHKIKEQFEDLDDEEIVVPIKKEPIKVSKKEDKEADKLKETKEFKTLIGETKSIAIQASRPLVKEETQKVASRDQFEELVDDEMLFPGTRDSEKFSKKESKESKEMEEFKSLAEDKKLKGIKMSRTSSRGEAPSKVGGKELFDELLDDEALFPPKKESMKISKTIETQTNDVEFPSGYVTRLQSESVEINIPETKVVRDGLIYTYLVYKIVTRLKDEEDKQAEFTVYRRYSDFDWLFENIANKYYGYIIPIPPPKNILTAFNKEGIEFAETRKKELLVFLRKSMQHPFLRHTPELNIFLCDDKGFTDFKKKEQSLAQNKKDYSVLSNISKIISGATKGTPYQLRELNDPEGDLYNYEVTFLNMKKRLQSFLTQYTDYLQLKRKQTAALISFTHELENTLSDSRFSGLEKAFRVITMSNISKIEDDLIKDMTERMDAQLKDVLSNVDAVNSAVERRNNLTNQLSEMHVAIEEKSLKFKKDAMNGEELEDLKKEYERLKKRCQEASEILLKELKLHKQKLDEDLAFFLKSLSGRNEHYFQDVYELWRQTTDDT